MNYHRVRGLAFLFAGFAGFLAGCGGGTDSEREGSRFDDPDASIISAASTPSPLPSTGGRVALTFNVFRRGGTYLTAAAAPPSFSIEDASGNVVEEHALTLEQRYPAESKRPNEDNSGTYSGLFIAPANNTAKEQKYHIAVKIPQTNGNAFRKVLPESLAVITVPSSSTPPAR